MRWYSLASEPKMPQKADVEPSDKGTLYDWALGRRPSGTPQESPHVHIEPPSHDLDAYEVARLIRGEDA